MEKIYDFKALTSKGKEIDFAQFKGKVLMNIWTFIVHDFDEYITVWVLYIY